MCCGALYDHPSVVDHCLDIILKLCHEALTGHNPKVMCHEALTGHHPKVVS